MFFYIALFIAIIPFFYVIYLRYRSMNESVPLIRNYGTIQDYDLAIDSILNTEKFTITSFDDAFEINPIYADALSRKALSLYLNKEKGKAIRALDEVIRISPKSANALNTKGIILGLNGDYEEALVCFDRALSEDPLFVQARCNRGKALDYLGKPIEAFIAYNEAIRTCNEDTSSAWVNKYLNFRSTQLKSEASFEEPRNGLLKDWWI